MTIPLFGILMHYFCANYSYSWYYGDDDEDEPDPEEPNLEESDPEPEPEEPEPEPEPEPVEENGPWWLDPPNPPNHPTEGIPFSLLYTYQEIPFPLYPTVVRRLPRSMWEYLLRLSREEIRRQEGCDCKCDCKNDRRRSLKRLAKYPGIDIDRPDTDRGDKYRSLTAFGRGQHKRFHYRTRRMWKDTKNTPENWAYTRYGAPKFTIGTGHLRCISCTSAIPDALLKECPGCAEHREFGTTPGYEKKTDKNNKNGNGNKPKRQEIKYKIEEIKRIHRRNCSACKHKHWARQNNTTLSTKRDAPKEED